MDVSLPRAPREEGLICHEAHARGGQRDRMEGAGAVDQAIPRADCAGQAHHGRHHRGSAGTGRIHVGHRPDRIDGGLIRRNQASQSRMAAGARQRQGNSRQRFVAGNADARCKGGPAPDEYMDMRFQPAHQSLFTNVPGRAPTPMCTTTSRPALPRPPPAITDLSMRVLSPCWILASQQECIVRGASGRQGIRRGLATHRDRRTSCERSHTTASEPEGKPRLG